jgi:hypothetical protein
MLAELRAGSTGADSIVTSTREVITYCQAVATSPEAEAPREAANAAAPRGAVA